MFILILTAHSKSCEWNFEYCSKFSGFAKKYTQIWTGDVQMFQTIVQVPKVILSYNPWVDELRKFVSSSLGSCLEKRTEAQVARITSATHATVSCCWTISLFSCTTLSILLLLSTTAGAFFRTPLCSSSSLSWLLGNCLIIVFAWLARLYWNGHEKLVFDRRPGRKEGCF
ncbi:uncharacterized protein LOC114724269 isoform X2 [Neltuma alba]|uniref:uncharacterized protein LOC114724269 isoform X2 n=1 Tax=Neltuma alba TaxID=207710 RepID=UPI0010A47136|nr:uncharacterized protein LOC114724269 isoform X2 [Prosopis alba]